MRKIVSIWIVLVASIAVWAVPASREPIIRYRSDGRADTVYLHGDEFFHYTSETKQDTRSIRRSPQQVQLASSMPSHGHVRIPVILVNFTDLSFSLTNPTDQFNDFFNGNGGSNPNATGSVHTYYYASSNSMLDLEYEVLGPYTLSHDMAYYGGNKTNSDGSASSHNTRAAELVKEAVQLAVNNGVNFSRYDANNDNVIDNVSIVVAGHNEAEGGKAASIWPHYSVIPNSRTYNGKYIYGYLMISEYRGSRGQIQAGIGTYCHEFGHALGLPDLYDTQYSDTYTVGQWDIMCSGCYNNNGSTPPTFTAFERFMMGWLTPRQVDAPGLLTLPPIETSNEALLIAASKHNMNAFSPSPYEYFLLENRQAVGWDAGNEALVATGLLVSHITFNVTTWNYNTFNASKPLGFNIVSAGYSNPSQSSAADIFPGSSKRTVWHPTLNNGTVLSNFVVSQIRPHSDGDIAMNIGDADDNIMSFSPEEAVVKTTFLSEPVAYDTVEVQLHIPAIAYDSLRFRMESSRFRYSIDHGATWFGYNDTAWLAIERDSSYNTSVLAVYLPTWQTCDYISAFLSVETQDELYGTQLTLQGTSPRPILITTPVIDTVTDVSSHSLSVHWQPVNDADGYYYALYTMSSGSIDYIYRLKEHIIYRGGDNVVFRNLEPSETYYFVMQAYDAKGCEEHTSALTSPIAIRTSDSPDNRQLIVRRNSDGHYTAVLPEIADGYHHIAIYDYMGHLTYSMRPAYGDVEVELPALRQGFIYMVKYYSETMRRKDLSTKVLYY